jgi:hypothetical protein
VADHSRQSSTEVKNAWSYTSTLPYVFMAWWLGKHRDNFALLTFVTTTVMMMMMMINYRGSRVRFPAGAGNFSLRHRVQNGSGAHRGLFPWG